MRKDEEKAGTLQRSATRQVGCLVADTERLRAATKTQRLICRTS
jgi:hypothetical protein